MLQQGSFIREKYRKIYFASLLGALANGLNVMLDSVLSGNILGETALTAVSIVTPLSYIIIFLASIYSSGYGILYGRHSGSFDKEGAYKIAGQAMVVTAFFSVFMMVLFILIKQPFLRYYGCTGELYEYASAYYNWRILSACTIPFVNMLFYLLQADADTALLSIGGTLSIVVNVVFSILLCRKIGVNGLGWGTFLCEMTMTIFYVLHFFKKSNSIHFKLCFQIKEFWTAVKLSSAFCLSYLFVAITDIVMNKIILVSCGVAMVAAYSSINVVYSLYDTFAAPYNSSQGLISNFMGERNNYGTQTALKTCIKSTIWQGLVTAALLVIIAPWLPKLYGMTTPEVIEESVKATRWMALAAVPYGISYVMQSLYPTLNKIGLGIGLTFLNDLICPLLVSIPLSFALGFVGVSIGMGLNAYLVLGLFALCIRLIHGKQGFPLYLANYQEEVVTFDLEVSPETVVEIRDKVKQEFDKKGYGIENLELLIEELYKRIYEKNLGKTVISECVLLFGEDYVRIIVRDDGEIFNFVDENSKVESLSAYTLNCLLERMENKEYLLTTSFNRNGFVFKKA